MTTPQTPAPQAGPELDAEIWALLGYPKPLIPPEYFRLGEVQFPWHFVGFNGNDPIWNVAAISTDPGAAFRALEMWRKQKAGVWLIASSPNSETGGYWHVELHLDDDTASQASAATFPLAAAQALRSALAATTPTAEAGRAQDATPAGGR